MILIPWNQNICNVDILFTENIGQTRVSESKIVGRLPCYFDCWEQRFGSIFPILTEVVGLECDWM